MVYQSWVGHTAGVMHLRHVTLLVVNVIGNVRHGSYHVHVELTVKALLHNLHVQQSEETATETET